MYWAHAVNDSGGRMNSFFKNFRSIIQILGCIFILSLTLGCNGFKSAYYTESLSNQSSNTPPPAPGPDNGDVGVVVGTKTVSVGRIRAAYDSMVSMAGITPTTNTVTAFNNNVGSFSETGSVLSINSPMLMSFVAVGSEVCDDLVDQENNAATRRFFLTTNFNFSANEATALKDNNLTDTNVPAGVADATRRLARQFWQRNETPSELGIINAGVQEILTGTNIPTTSSQRRVALFICSAMIASTAAYQM